MTEITETAKGPGTVGKALIVVALALVVAATLIAKNSSRNKAETDSDKKEIAVSAELAAAVSANAPLAATAPSDPAPRALPKLVDLGAGKCIPCKMMAPILEELKTAYAGSLDVVFIDVWEKPDEAERYGINLIPTQIFYDATGKERFRHEGFFAKEDILAKWKELGVDLKSAASLAPAEPAFSRLEPAAPDTRAKETICYMCDGEINPKSRAVLKTDMGDVGFCGLHCYFITSSSMPENPPSVENVSVTDWATGDLTAAASAKYVYGVDVKNRPTIKAFAGRAAAEAERRAAGGNVVEWAALQDKELAIRCGFCDRAVYSEDACPVRVEGGLSTWGCCTMCALGVASRLQKDIEIAARDSLTGEKIIVKTVSGHVGLLKPESAVAWAGTRKDAEGKLVSTGCFKQAFFVNEENLKKWVEAEPTATGRMISIEQALAEKMRLTPQQIAKACKIGECSPK